MQRPVIGITTSYGKHNEMMEGVYVHHDYHRTVARHGAIPVLIPNADVESARAVLPMLNGLILSGGEDVNPKFYGEDPHQKLGPAYTLRDEIEIALAQEAVALQLPLFAICRGAQVLNVAFGGSLIQDLPSQMPHTHQHAQQNPRGEDSHFVSVAPDSRLFSLICETELRVNSLHHQAIGRLGTDLQCTASARDGVIEAIEHTGPGFVLGVQWHPESMAANGDPVMNRLFAAFITITNERLVSRLSDERVLG